MCQKWHGVELLDWAKRENRFQTTLNLYPSMKQFHNYAWLTATANKENDDQRERTRRDF